MEIILEVLGTLATAMAIIDAEYLEFGPFLRGNPRCLLCRLYHVEDDRDSVFVGLSHDAYIRVCSEGLD